MVIASSSRVPVCYRKCADMFDFIIHTSLRQRLIVLGLSLVLIIYGAITLRRCQSMYSPTSISRP